MKSLIDKIFPLTDRTNFKNRNLLIEEMNNRFIQGYTCAVANLVKMTGDANGTTECELLACSVSTLDGLKKAKCDPNDIQTLLGTLKELERKRKLLRASAKIEA